MRFFSSARFLFSAFAVHFARRRGRSQGGTGLVLVLVLVLGVLTDSASLCREAFMRSGLRGGGSGGSDAAIVGPAARPLICIPPLAPTTTLLYCTVLCTANGNSIYTTVGHNKHTDTRTHALQLPQLAACAARSNILTTLQSNRRQYVHSVRERERRDRARETEKHARFVHRSSSTSKFA